MKSITTNKNWPVLKTMLLAAATAFFLMGMYFTLQGLNSISAPTAGEAAAYTQTMQHNTASLLQLAVLMGGFSITLHFLLGPRIAFFAKHKAASWLCANAIGFVLLAARLLADTGNMQAAFSVSAGWFLGFLLCSAFSAAMLAAALQLGKRAANKA